MIDFRNMDCMELMKEFPDNHFDLAIVDPPYGININTSIGRRKGDAKSDYHKFAGADKEITNKEYFEELKRVSKNQVVWGGNYMTDHLQPSACWLLWDKGFSEDVTFAQFELAWTSFNSSAKKYDKHPSQQFRIHPTQKPTDLYKWILSRYAKAGDLILDTHVGSASSLIACHQLGFDAVGCELDKEYFDMANRRLKEEQAQLSLFA